MEYKILDFQLRTKGSEGDVVELRPITSYNCLWDSKLADDIFRDELGNVFILDAGISFCLYPFVEVIYGYKRKLFMCRCDG